MIAFDRELIALFGGIGLILIIATIATAILTRRLTAEKHTSLISNLNQRISAWWVMIAIFAIAMLVGRTGTVILFALISFLALREFITLSPTKKWDHRALLWLFFAIVPIHYYLVWDNAYGMYTIFIPVYAFLLLPARSALAGQTEHFLERAATIQWALMVTVYAVSHAPALLYLPIGDDVTDRAKLLLFLFIVAQGSDVLQYIWGKTKGKRKIAPTVSPNKTVEGFVGGVTSATLIGSLLWWATPFNPFQAAGMAFVICIMGFLGGLVMSSIKRDRGVKDFGALIAGHGGVMDRIDSIAFAAPVFFHLTRYFFA